MYRIAETSVGVATEGSRLAVFFAEELEDGVGRAIDGSRRAEAMADFGEVAADGFAGALVVQQTKDLGGYAFGSEIVLNQFGDGAFSGDEVDHAEERRAHQGLGESGGERRYA